MCRSFYLWCSGLSVVMACSCAASSKRYHDFSFLKQQAEIQAITTATIEPATYLPDSCWVRVATFAPEFDLRYEVYMCPDDSLNFIIAGDTLSIQQMLGPDVQYLSWFSTSNFHLESLAEIQDAHNNRFLFGNVVRETMGSRPDAYLNFIFPLDSRRKIQGALAYISNGPVADSLPNVQFVCDRHHNGYFDLVQWIYTGGGEYVNTMEIPFQGKRRWRRTSYQCGTYQGIGWYLAKKTGILIH